MNIEEFGKIMVNELEGALGDEYEVEYKEMLKNNSVVNHTICIKKTDENISPAIYIDSFYEEYKRGTSIGKLVDDYIGIYREHSPKEPIDMSFYTDFSNVVNNLSFKVVNKAGNEKMLIDVPYREYEDLALVPMCLFESDEIGKGNIVIKNNHLDMWEISIEELWENVMEYSPVNSPVKLRDLLQLLEEINKIKLPENTDERRMIVAGNSNDFYGAGVIFYPGVLKELSERLGGDIFIIPSSVHEVIALKACKEDKDGMSLRDIIKEVNTTTLEPKDFLSDNLYLYEAKADKLRIYNEE
ncbi:hypothetical protein D6853_06930 [Butyrivibrio sp. X503]|uniref:DUF5688 family protein n=1 Tax=Butyrivibrio sp. X503 TaxID=2364878 RepID=UPI000EAA8079|nr:DUF5688 family protein [Butyrivibrio sp. X503]RKM56514.1 hypothetical protein D6853_06930 [Butyrivibrio sp. X503]